MVVQIISLGGHYIRLGARPWCAPKWHRDYAQHRHFCGRYHYGLKIWDAYRPKSVQVELWQAALHNGHVADPEASAGSLHSWGVAVDAAFVDLWNRPVQMPTDFDDFTPAAMWHYHGANSAIRSHVYLLQVAMRDAGFTACPRRGGIS